jgi:hypothetical protein
MTDARAIDVHAEAMTAVIASDRVSHSLRRAAGTATQRPRGRDGDADVRISPIMNTETAAS